MYHKGMNVFDACQSVDFFNRKLDIVFEECGVNNIIDFSKRKDEYKNQVAETIKNLLNKELDEEIFDKHWDDSQIQPYKNKK